MAPTGATYSKELLIRLGVFTSSIGVWLFGLYLFKPWIRGFFTPFIKSFPEGPRLLLNHVLIFSTPVALLCILWLVLLQRTRSILPVKFHIDLNVITSGLVWGLLISAVTLAIAPLLGLTYGFHLNLWGIVGNLISNIGEEIVFRGLLLFSILKLVESKPIAIMISGIFFGFSHEQYPMEIKIYISLVGSSLSFLTAKDRNLGSAIVAHCISDWILDLFL